MSDSETLGAEAVKCAGYHWQSDLACGLVRWHDGPHVAVCRLPPKRARVSWSDGRQLRIRRIGTAQNA